METPPEISFRNLEPTEELKRDIHGRVEKLENFYEPIITCRVMVEVPHKRHETGNQYHVRIDARVPGKELVVSQDPGDDPSREDLSVALTSAFHAMERQLEDYARKQRGDVKHPDVDSVGRVRDLFLGEGYGFIESEDGREIYFHENDVREGDFEQLEKGTPVAFAEEPGEEGPQASAVRPYPRSRP